MGTFQHAYLEIMSAITQASAQVAKTVAVTTGKVANAKSMMIWRPHGNKMFETFSFLPPLSDAEISKQVQYLLNNGWAPCIEFEDSAHAYTDGHAWANMDTSINAGYYDNRYWVMWKLPMYGCQTRMKSLRKSTPASSASRNATSASLASTTSSKCNAPRSWLTARRPKLRAPLTSAKSKGKYLP